MTDAEIIEIIADGIVDGTDMDCTPADQARAVLKALRDAGVAVGDEKAIMADAYANAARAAFEGVKADSRQLTAWADKLNGRKSVRYRIFRTSRDARLSVCDKIRAICIKHTGIDIQYAKEPAE